MFKKYMVYLDDGSNVYKCAIPATSKAKAKAYVAGNGEVVNIQEIECNISLDKVAVALKNANFDQTQIDLITRTLIQTNIAE